MPRAKLRTITRSQLSYSSPASPRKLHSHIKIVSLNFEFFFCLLSLRGSSNSRAQNLVTFSAAITGYLIEIGESNPVASSRVGWLNAQRNNSWRSWVGWL